MRVPVICLLALVTPVFATADVIHLKNGRTIWADHVHDTGTKVEYDLGEDTYAIPKASVERIENGGVPPQYASGGSSKEPLPSFAPAESLKNEDLLTTKVIQEGKVDPDALKSSEQQGSTTAATAYYVAGKFEYERANFIKSRTYLETALRFDSQNATVLNYLAALLVR